MILSILIHFTATKAIIFDYDLDIIDDHGESKNCIECYIFVHDHPFKIIWNVATFSVRRYILAFDARLYLCLIVLEMEWKGIFHP